MTPGEFVRLSILALWINLCPPVVCFMTGH